MKQPSNNLALRVPFLCLFAVFFACLSSLKAQDPSLSQFFANRMYLNPAFTGMEEGLQVTLSSRNQWYAADKGYSFVTAAAELQEPCLNSGFGIMITHAREGLAPMKTTAGSLSYAFMPHNAFSNFHGGIQAGFIQKRLDWSSLTFSDQLDPVFGKIYDSAMAAGNESVSVFDVAAGFIYRWDSNIRSNAKTQKSFRSHIGIAMHHFVSLWGEGPDASILKTGAEIPGRITIHGGTIIPLTFLRGVNNNLVLSPNFRFESQGAQPANLKKSLTHFSGGLYVVFRKQFTAGALYHTRAPFAGAKHTNSVTGSIGFTNQDGKAHKNPFYVGFSVDVNTSGLGLRSNNAYEFSYRYTFLGLKTYCDRKHAPTKGKRGKRNKPLPCPVFEY